MWSNAQPVRSEPWGGLEQCSQTDIEKEGNCLWPGKPTYSLGQARLMEKMGEGQGERDGERTERDVLAD